MTDALADRYYDLTIPSYGGPGPARTATVTVATSVDPDTGYATLTDRHGRVVTRLLMPEDVRAGYRLVRAAQQKALRADIERRCAGHIRRQARRHA